MDNTIELCHCGRPVYYNDELEPMEPAFTRGMCEDCDSVRCDVDPSNCATEQERAIRAAASILLSRWHENAEQQIENSPEGFCRIHAEDLYQAGALAPVRPSPPAQRRESWVTLTETCNTCSAVLEVSGTAQQVRAMSIVFGTHHGEEVCKQRSNVLYSSMDS